MRKYVHKNYYKNSRALKRARIIKRCVVCLKVLLVVGGMGATSLLFILVHDALTQSAYFETRTIAVEGNWRLSSDAILKAAGLKLHDNILSLNLKAVRYRLLSNPWISSAEVERRLPDTIRVRIRERVPIAILDLGRHFYLDQDGEIFKSVEPSDQVKVPLVTGLTLADIDLDHPWRARLFRAVMQALRLSQLQGSAVPLHALHRIHVDPAMGLTLFVFDSKLAVKMGFGNYKSKYNRLRDMITYLSHGDQHLYVRSIDLNDLDRVVVRPSAGVSFQDVCYRKEM